MSHQPSIGAVSEDWHRNLRYPPGSSPRDLGAGPAWKLHGHLMAHPQHSPILGIDLARVPSNSAKHVFETESDGNGSNEV